MNLLKSKTLLIIISIIALFIISPAHAKDIGRELHRGDDGERGNEHSEHISHVEHGDAMFAGNGCPDGTMRVAFAPDNLSFSILFDNFVTELQPASNAKMARMSCNLIVPIQLPEGMQMQITRVDYRGFVELPAGTRATLNSSLSYGGEGNRLRFNFNFNGPTSDNYVVSSDVLTSNSTQSRDDGNENHGDSEGLPCGGAISLKIQNQLSLATQTSGVAAMATIDSIDGAAHAVYFVNWKKCSAKHRENKDDREHPQGHGD